MILTVTGGRDHHPANLFAMDAARAAIILTTKREPSIHIGDALGVDDAAIRWALDRGLARRLRIWCASSERRDLLMDAAADGAEIYQASDWNLDGKRAGRVRTSQLLREAAQGAGGVLVAYPGGKGTAGALKDARRLAPALLTVQGEPHSVAATGLAVARHAVALSRASRPVAARLFTSRCCQECGVLLGHEPRAATTADVRLVPCPTPNECAGLDPHR